MVKDLISSCHLDSGWTMYEFACAMKCSVKRLIEIKSTGRITKRKWDLLGEILRDVYSEKPDYDDIPW
jgi:hypothetical protein